MAIRGVTFTNGTIQPMNDGAIWQWISHQTDYCMTRDTVFYSQSGNTFTFYQNHFMIGGRLVFLTQTTVACSPTVTNGVGRLLFVINNANTSSWTVAIEEEYQSTEGDFVTLTQDNINNMSSGATYETEICRFTVSSGTISSPTITMGRGKYGPELSVIRLTHTGTPTANGWQQPFTLSATEILSGFNFTNSIGTYQFTLGHGGYHIDVTASLPTSTGVYGIGIGSGSSVKNQFPHYRMDAFSGITNDLATSGIYVISGNTDTINPILYSNVAGSSTGTIYTTITKLW